MMATCHSLAGRGCRLRTIVAIDTNDPAYKLAQAVDAAIKGDLDAIDRAFKELKPTTATLTRTYTILLTTAPFSSMEAPRLILNTLQYRLAEKTAQRLYVLTWVLVVLTVGLFGFGIFDICMRLHG
jgi:hypothetical protein